jgi:hypothetical protein
VRKYEYATGGPVAIPTHDVDDLSEDFMNSASGHSTGDGLSKQDLIKSKNTIFF